MDEPLDVAIMVTLSEAKEALELFKRLQLLRLERSEVYTLMWLENATSRAIHQKER